MSSETLNLIVSFAYMFGLVGFVISLFTVGKQITKLREGVLQIRLDQLKLLHSLSTFLPITKTLETMKQDLDALTAEVAQDTSVVSSAVTLLGNLGSQLSAAITALKNGDDGAQLNQLQATLANSRQELAAAIVANTPADANATGTGTQPGSSGTPDAGAGGNTQPSQQTT